MWQWTFENGVPPQSYVQNPQNVLYGSTGKFKVTLISSNALTMDSLTKTFYIVVFDSPYPRPEGYCDTTSNVLPSEQPKTFRHFTIPTNNWGGYFPGHAWNTVNLYKAKCYAERFTNYTISNIHELIVWPAKSFAAFSSPIPSNQRVKWHVWSVDSTGVPGSE